MLMLEILVNNSHHVEKAVDFGGDLTLSYRKHLELLISKYFHNLQAYSRLGWVS